ncbi:YfeC-like transcriptional regulator [Cronobacter sakazakii]|uniref:YfeC-like transcriptional regulator n=1 Tax=Cronobacter sakazakii TaxID=28141 RepID=UPI0009B9AAD8|nr:YfeC-like transcriptional regulator [Cronobacter sakazakii]
MVKDRMTPDELAHYTGYSRQTINKWVRREGWHTSPKPGVQGGKARVIHIDEEVLSFIRSARRVSDNEAPYTATVDAPLENLLLNSLREMSQSEQKQLTSLLLREGIAGLLQRLDIRHTD